MVRALGVEKDVCRYAESLRRAIAARRDRLVGRQRQSYSVGRQRQIDTLAEDYDTVLNIAIRAGAERGCGTR